jgi:site-specific recombinase XerD
MATSAPQGVRLSFSLEAKKPKPNCDPLRPLTTKAVCELVKRRLKDAGLASRLSPHSFRVTAITDLLTQGVPLEDVQYLAGHAEPRTTGLYDRRQKIVTRKIVERISIQSIIGSKLSPT